MPFQKEASEDKRFKIGEVARRAGVTVRTLHHYDSIGLVSPAGRSAAGYRLYGPADLERLARVILFRRLGFSLAEIGAQLDGSPLKGQEDGAETSAPMSLPALLREHARRLRRRITEEERLAARLESIADHLGRGKEPTAEDLMTTLEKIKMHEKYFTPDQMDTLARRREELGAEKIEATQQEWPGLIADVRAAMAAGKPASDPAVQALARRWTALVAEFTGGDPEMSQSLRTMYKQEPDYGAQWGLDADLFAYVNAAKEALQTEGDADAAS